VIVLENSVRRWVAAYQEYQRACQAVDANPRGSAAAHAVATASWGVASAWRELATAPEMPWWVVAAVDTSAEVFEEQARAWTAHAGRLGGA
jgi:hypothetical protein